MSNPSDQLPPGTEYETVLFGDDPGYVPITVRNVIVQSPPHILWALAANEWKARCSEAQELAREATRLETWLREAPKTHPRRAPTEAHLAALIYQAQYINRKLDEAVAEIISLQTMYSQELLTPGVPR